MLFRVSICSIFLVMILLRCVLPEEKPGIIPFPQQSVSDKGDFIFDETTLISVENKQQTAIAQELAGLFKLAAGFTPHVAIQNKQANIIFRTDMGLPAEHYKLNISPSCILVEASGPKGFFYAVQTVRFLLPSSINSKTRVENIRWCVPGMIIKDGPQHHNRTVVLHLPFDLIPENNLKDLIDNMAMLKINRLHFMKGFYDTTPNIQMDRENMILYAKSKKITISSGMIRPEGIVSNLPFDIEQLIQESDILDSHRGKKKLFQHLASIAEKSWSGTLKTESRQEFDKNSKMSALHLEARCL